MLESVKKGLRNHYYKITVYLILRENFNDVIIRNGIWMSGWNGMDFGIFIIYILKMRILKGLFN